MLIIIFHWFFTCRLVAGVTSSLIWSLWRLLMCCSPEAYKKPCDLRDCWVQEQNHYPAYNYDFQSLSFELAPSLAYFFFFILPSMTSKSLHSQVCLSGGGVCRHTGFFFSLSVLSTEHNSAIIQMVSTEESGRVWPALRKWCQLPQQRPEPKKGWMKSEEQRAQGTKTSGERLQGKLGRIWRFHRETRTKKRKAIALASA